jgi:hypothetical protein
LYSKQTSFFYPQPCSPPSHYWASYFKRHLAFLYSQYREYSAVKQKKSLLANINENFLWYCNLDSSWRSTLIGWTIQTEIQPLDSFHIRTTQC